MTQPKPATPPGSALTLLNGRHVATLATQRADGSIHLAAIWFLYDDGILYFPTNSSSQKARNVARTPTASAMIDTRVPGQEQGVSVSGHATIVDGPQGRALVAQTQRRYLTTKALNESNVGATYAEFDDVVIALTPERWTTWDIARMNQNTFGGILGVASGYLYPYD